VFFAAYSKIENFMKLDGQMGSRSYPKIDLSAISGPTLDVFGSVWLDSLRQRYGFYCGLQQPTFD